MSTEQPGVIRRFFRGLWNTLDFTRRLIFNLIFLFLLVAFIGGVFASRTKIALRTALVLNPEGRIIEQYTSDPVQRAMASFTGDGLKEVQLRDVLRVIDAAAKDARIERIVLVPDEIDGTGLSTLREIGVALDRFEEAGKEVIAVSAGMDQDQYFLAAHANRILLDPDGAVMLEGLSNYHSYFKDGLDKLGVQVHLVKVGAYKSAAEPLVLNQASEEAKEADRYWMSGIWREYLDEIAVLRNIDAAKIDDDIAHYDERVAHYSGNLAQLALDQKLVDQVATRREARALLRAAGAADDSDGFRQIDFRKYLATLNSGTLKTRNDQVAVIIAQGEIVPGDQSGGTIGGRSTAQLVRAAREDERVKAIVLRVNSPGGEVSASELIRRELAQVREEGMPVVVSMGDVAASGGYWISMDSDEIWAQPTTITGSIGVFGLFITLPDTLAKLGIHNDGVGTTPLAGAMDIRRPLSPQIQAILTSMIQRDYSQFIDKVAKARSKAPEQIEAIAQGRVWTGTQAKERGLVDKLGGLNEAIAAAAARANLGKNYGVTYVEREMTPWERFALSLGNSDALVRLARYAGFSMPAAAIGSTDAKQITGVLQSLRGKHYGAFVHCFCGLH
ncbi:MAG: signal peptide peptidase SppA [Rhodanobacter sp.]|jgi:protease-4|nr:signal peptide peptidase SppA [Rhodanobacter sp.]